MINRGDMEGWIRAAARGRKICVKGKAWTRMEQHFQKMGEAYALQFVLAYMDWIKKRGEIPTKKPMIGTPRAGDDMAQWAAHRLMLGSKHLVPEWWKRPGELLGFSTPNGHPDEAREPSSSSPE